MYTEIAILTVINIIIWDILHFFILNLENPVYIFSLIAHLNLDSTFSQKNTWSAFRLKFTVEKVDSHTQVIPQCISTYNNWISICF